LKKQVFGPKSERYIPTIDPGQLNIFGDADQEESLNSSPQSEKETITYQRKKNKGSQQGRQLLKSCSHLPVEGTIIEPEHNDADIYIGDEITEKLAKQPGKLYIKRIIIWYGSYH
jgi:hypothetical protein